MLLDTDFLIALIRKESNAIKKLEELTHSSEGAFITHINIWELYKGAYLSPHPARNTRICDELLSFFSLLPFTQDVNHKFGQLNAELTRKGTPIGVMDTLIASIALEYKQVLITRNTKHFKLTGVSLASW